MTPSHPPRLDVALLDRYLAGVCTSAEAETVGAWLRGLPEAGDLVTTLQRLHADPALRSDAAEVEAVAALRTRLEARLGLGEGTLPPTSTTSSDSEPGHFADRLALMRRRVTSTTRGSGGAVAGIAVTGLAIPTAVGQMLRRLLPGLATVLVLVGIGVAMFHRPHVMRVSTQHYATQSGQQATVQLPNGSRILLAPRTQITVASHLETDATTVTLVGEAQFDIAPHPRAPFVVRTGDVVTRVLGTVFTVRRYAGDAEGRVAVTSGKVSVQAGRQSITLTAGMIGRYTAVAVTSTADSTIDTDWTHGRLVFRNAPVSTVLSTLSRWYGYQFRLTDTTLARQHVTTSFDFGSAAEMLQGLKWLLHVDMTFEDSVVTLRSARRVSGPQDLKRDDRLGLPSPPIMEVGR
jgi:ferric-dicitrate binding protein FerR (iron transport regulator)